MQTQIWSADDDCCVWGEWCHHKLNSITFPHLRIITNNDLARWVQEPGVSVFVHIRSIRHDVGVVSRIYRNIETLNLIINHQQQPPMMMVILKMFRLVYAFDKRHHVQVTQVSCCCCCLFVCLPCYCDLNYSFVFIIVFIHLMPIVSQCLCSRTLVTNSYLFFV